mmetsp:Transcript_33887/g.103667  ORF Transcript_33887/g.103667 Transcript_33887/m.103667 type:complete len:445 (-) Transcript_33887:201-1535(-)
MFALVAAVHAAPAFDAVAELEAAKIEIAKLREEALSFKAVASEREALFSSSPIPEPMVTPSFKSVQPGVFDISGMAYLGGIVGGDGKFLAVHDAKPKEDSDLSSGDPKTRVSMFMLPKKEEKDATEGLEGGLMHLEFTDLAFPDPPGIITGHRSTDLESVARIPGTNLVLLCESGNSADDACNATRADPKHGLPDPTWRYDATASKTDPTFCETPPPRIYVSEVTAGEKPTVTIKQEIYWTEFYPGWVNVEATAVGKWPAPAPGAPDLYVFLWAERESTTIHYTELKLDANRIVSIVGPNGYMHGNKSFNLPPPMSQTLNRPIVSLDVDDSGGIYAAAAYDNDVGDFGPYNSAVYKIGELTFHPEFLGFPMVEIYPEPTMFAEVNGFKVEAVARADKVPVNMYEDGEASAVSGPMTFLGTDDENYGGTLRPINLTLADLEHDEL